MAAVAGACLGDETIAAMLEGGLAGDAVRRAREHIASCDACRGMVSAAIDAELPASASAVAYRIGGAIGPGTTIGGRYQIERPLGEGGMGHVYVAHQHGLERRVAIKILRAELSIDHDTRARFHREAKLIASLASEHVVRVHDLGELDTGEPYIVMELLDGEDLSSVVARGPVHVEYARAWILAACSALAEAHALGIVHRDIKPSNLFLTRQGRLVVLDFGIAKVASRQARLTGAGMLIGSPHYMSPEQITGAAEVGPGADIWSIGATLYQLVTGRTPFAAPALDELLSLVLHGGAVAVDGLPPDIAYVVSRALERDPRRRFAAIGELAHALRPPAPAPQVARSRPGAVVWILGAAVVIGAIALVAIAPWSSSSSSSSAPTKDKRPAAPRITEARLTARMDALGYAVDITRADNQYPRCKLVSWQLEKLDVLYEIGSLMLLDCEDDDAATENTAHLRKYYAGYGMWIEQRGPQVFMASVTSMGMPKASESKALFVKLLADNK